MTTPCVRRLLPAGLATVLCACGSSPITSARIEQSIAPTFANLVQVQVSAMGLPPMAAADFAVTANCRKLQVDVAANHQRGSGEWTCTLLWKGPDRQPLRDAYDLFVTTDGCFAATVAGEAL